MMFIQGTFTGQIKLISGLIGISTDNHLIQPEGMCPRSVFLWQKSSGRALGSGSSQHSQRFYDGSTAHGFCFYDNNILTTYYHSNHRCTID